MRRRARGRQSGGIATCGMWCASHSGRRFCPQCCLWSRRFSRPRALSTPFSGRLALLRLCAMTLILPVLVAVFGILSVYGRQGWLASLWQMLGLQWTFSPTACRAFYWRTSFNLPMASRLLLQSLESIPGEQRQLAAQLGMRGWHFPFCRMAVAAPPNSACRGADFYALLRQFRNGSVARRRPAGHHYRTGYLSGAQL